MSRPRRLIETRHLFEPSFYTVKYGKYNNLVFQALFALLWNELPTVCMHVTIIESVFNMYGLNGWSGWTSVWRLELSPPGRRYLRLSKAHKNLTLNQGGGGELHARLHGVPFNSLWSFIILHWMNRLQGTSNPRHPLQVALILYNGMCIHVRKH